tara:strand:+ start:16242 stop:16379 length:138 start_codon:yes stop_codon:yes gene_type:complete
LEWAGGEIWHRVPLAIQPEWGRLRDFGCIAVEAEIQIPASPFILK